MLKIGFYASKNQDLELYYTGLKKKCLLAKGAEVLSASNKTVIHTNIKNL